MATKLWTGLNATDAKWSRTDNWSPSGAPVAGDALQFGGTTRLTTDNDIAADTSFASITFNSGAGTFVLGGNRITLGGNITNSDDSLQTISFDMILGATRTVNCASGDITISGVISSTGGLTKTGSSTLKLTGTNSYSGDSTISSGMLEGTNTSAFGTGILIANGGTLGVHINGAGSGGTITFTNSFWINTSYTGTIDVNNNGSNTGNTVVFPVGSFGASLQLNVTGGNSYKLQLTDVDLSGGGLNVTFNPTTAALLMTTVTCGTDYAHTLVLDGTNTGNIISGAITNGEGTTAVAKSNSGTWVISGTSTYTGTTTVTAGTFLVTGSITGTGAVTVSNTATLGGTGTIAGAITQSSGSIIAPGIGGTTIGTLGTANVTMNASSTYSVDLDGTTPTFDQINSSGTVACAGTLTVASIANAAIGKIYTIVNTTTSVSGTFTGLPNNGTFAQQGRRFRAVYAANTVKLIDCSNWVQSVITNLG